MLYNDILLWHTASVSIMAPLHIPRVISVSICIAQDTSNGVQSVDVVLYGLSFVIPLMNNELLKVSTFV